jgi:putative phosphonate metabolism protein
MTADSGRYAVYFAPDLSSRLASFGASWLGYDVATGRSVGQPEVSGISAERLFAITAEPRRYGFHATLKPPFALAAEANADELDEAVSALAGGFSALAAPRLRLARISGFWALMLSQPCAILHELAAICVSDLDRFRAPPSPEEQARRRSVGLSPAQEALLARWGYPYIMEEFRFHMTLTARLDADEGRMVEKALTPLVEPFCQTALKIDAISLFRQRRRDAPFRLLRRYKLDG